MTWITKWRGSSETEFRNRRKRESARDRYCHGKFRDVQKKRDLTKICEDIVKPRKLGERRYYVKYSSGVVRSENPESKVAVQNETPVKVPPASLCFRIRAEGWKTLSDFTKAPSEMSAVSTAFQSFSPLYPRLSFKSA
jgi:hypothetical protein